MHMLLHTDDLTGSEYFCNITSTQSYLLCPGLYLRMQRSFQSNSLRVFVTPALSRICCIVVRSVILTRNFNISVVILAFSIYKYCSALAIYQSRSCTLPLCSLTCSFLYWNEQERRISSELATFKQRMLPQLRNEDRSE